jgi:hypothetical protein
MTIFAEYVLLRLSMIYSTSPRSEVAPIIPEGAAKVTPDVSAVRNGVNTGELEATVDALQVAPGE